MQVNILEAKNRLSELIKTVQRGEEVVIANRGEPVARLVPTSTGGGSGAVGSAFHILQWLDLNPLPAHARRGVKEIEASILAERDAWD